MHSYVKQYGDMGGLADWRDVPDIEPHIPSLLAYCGSHHGAREISVFDDQRLTYGEAIERSAALALQLLEAGIGKGARVGMIFPNSGEFIITWLAITRIGAVAVPLSTLSSAVEFGRLIRHADLQLLVTAEQFLKHNYVTRLAEALPGLATARAPYRLEAAPFLRQIWVWGGQAPAWAKAVDLARTPAIPHAFLAQVERAITPADFVSIVYSSGSTAEPKGIIHSHGAFVRQAIKLSASYPYRGDDRIYTPMPFFWVGGLTLTLLNAMVKGATILGSGKSGSALLDFLERERVTYVFGWPHLIKALKAEPSFATRNFSALRGGPLLPPERQPRNQVFGNALGMTETCGPHTLSLRDYPDKQRGAFGPPMPGMELKIIDLETGAALLEGEKGELLVRGDTLMQGLVKIEREAVFEPDGWYHTRDLCSLEGGILFFHGRCDDMIKSSGANVSPREVEEAILALPGATHAIVMSVPDERRGTVVGAVIALEHGAPRDPEMLRKALADRLSSYKVPRVILTIEPQELPMMSSGKADRLLLAKRLIQAAENLSDLRKG